MSNRALKIGSAEYALIAALKAKAALPENVTSLAASQKIAQDTADGLIHPGENKANDHLTIKLPDGFNVTYTHEQQRPCECRHISISVDGAPEFGPAPEAVRAIIKLFGFKNNLDTAPPVVFWLGKTPDKRLIVEAVEPLDGDITKLYRKDG